MEQEKTNKRVIVTTKRELWIRCYEDDDIDEVVHEAFDDLGDYDELQIEETDDVVTEDDIEHAKNYNRYAEWLDD